MTKRIPPGYAARLPDGTLLTKDQQLNQIITVGRAEIAARSLFPDEYHDGSDCRSEIGREGQPCRACASQRVAWLDRITEVLRAMKAAFE